MWTTKETGFIDVQSGWCSKCGFSFQWIAMTGIKNRIKAIEFYMTRIFPSLNLDIKSIMNLFLSLLIGCFFLLAVVVVNFLSLFFSFFKAQVRECDTETRKSPNENRITRITKNCVNFARGGGREGGREEGEIYLITIIFCDCYKRAWYGKFQSCRPLHKNLDAMINSNRKRCRKIAIIRGIQWQMRAGRVSFQFQTWISS